MAKRNATGMEGQGWRETERNKDIERKEDREKERERERDRPRAMKIAQIYTGCFRNYRKSVL